MFCRNRNGSDVKSLNFVDNKQASNTLAVVDHRDDRRRGDHQHRSRNSNRGDLWKVS